MSSFRIHLPFPLLTSMLFLLLNLSLTQAHAGENSQFQQQTILVMGDSISAGFGIDKEKGWVALLANKLQQENPQYRLINASVSGETTSGGANRLKKLIDLHQPALVILELGGNDGLRGAPLKLMSQNLSYMINLSQKQGAKVLLLGMRIPPNYGQTYSERFASQYQKLASEHKAELVPFLLSGIAAEKGMMQDDGIHPTTKAQPLMAQSVWQALRPLM